MIAEKVRAAFQRAKVRDLYDLHRFATTPFDGEMLRALVVLKLWQVRGPFVPDALFEKLRSDKYDWADLQRLLRTADRVEPEELTTAVERRFDVLRHLTELEHLRASLRLASFSDTMPRPAGSRAQRLARLQGHDDLRRLVDDLQYDVAV